MNPLVMRVIEMLLGLMAPFLKKLVDLAYDRIEEWAKGKEEETGKKVPSEKKMKMAVEEVKAKRPELPDSAIRAMLEMRHAAKKERIGRKGKTRGGGT